MSETASYANADQNHCDLSVIVPLLNEEGNVGPLYTELHEVLQATDFDYEIIFVDDGSEDRTLNNLRAVTASDGRTIIIVLRRRFGQTAALAAGIEQSQGRIVVTMDGDLQNDPHDIPTLCSRLHEPPGFDLVSGWRRKRRDPWFSRRLPSQIANWIVGHVTGVPLHDFGCALKVYRREILDGHALYGELHRLLPAVASWQGARITELVVNHRPRIHGRAKYGWSRVGKVVLDLVTVKFLGGYMTKPLYFFGKLGLVTLLLSAATFGMAVLQRFGSLGQPEGLHLNRNILVSLSALLFFCTVQCILFGIVSELLIRIYHETRGIPTYRVLKLLRSDTSSTVASRDRSSAPIRPSPAQKPSVLSPMSSRQASS